MSLFFDKNVTFASLPLDRRVFKSLARQHLVYPSVIQSKVLPLALQGRDLQITARTGSGKTLSYAIPIIQTLLARTENEKSSNSSTSGIRSIILLPTRELCVQVKKVFDSLLFYCSDLFSTLIITADNSIPSQIQQLRELPSIIIATPARLIQHLNSGIVSLKSSLIHLVLDESDLLLSYDYQDDIQSLSKYLPDHYQTLLLSATLSSSVTELTNLLLKNPVAIKLDESAIPNSLQQFYIRTSDTDKGLLAYSLIKLKLIQGKTLFFVNSIDTAFKLKLLLEQFSIKSAVLNEALPYNSRLSILAQFNRGVFDYLIATDRATVRPNEKIGDEKNDRKTNDDGSVDEIVKVEEIIKEEEENSNENENATSEELEILDSKIIQPKTEIDGEENESNENSLLDDDATLVKDEPVDEIPAAVISRPRVPRPHQKRSREFGVSRGIDFQDVVTVVNFDFPSTVKSYIHRVGRTARAGKTGTSLSLATPSDEVSLQSILAHQINEESKTIINALPRLQQLNFQSSDVEGFRYRVEDVSRAVTGAAVREARLKDLKSELLNSTKLAAHFEDNPRELNLLRHDRILRPTKIQKHLSHVPEYLIPNGFNQEDVNEMGKKRKFESREGKDKKKKFSNRGKKQKVDPLRSFQFKGGEKSSTSGTSRKSEKRRSTKSAPEI